jgi:hypothetical protein
VTFSYWLCGTVAFLYKLSFFGGEAIVTSENTGIPCSCGSFASEVIRTRNQSGYITRRRECKSCGERFTTREAVVGTNEGKGATSDALFVTSIELLLLHILHGGGKFILTAFRNSPELDSRYQMVSGIAV